VHVGLAGGQQLAPAAVVELRLDLFEDDAGEAAVVVGEFLGTR
jgi:hypothetical protein